MTCDHFTATVHEYLRGALGTSDRAAIERHAQECARCGELMRLSQELTCREFVEFLNDFIDGDLPAERRAVFQRHLSVCPDCVTYMGTYQRTMDLSVSALRAEPVVPEEIPEALIRAILAARK